MTQQDVVGRDAELLAIGEFLAAVPSGSRAPVFAGPAGVGKTTLLRAGIDQAARAGYAVLRASPAPRPHRRAPTATLAR